MKKFGFGKKGGDDGDDASRNALFGSRNKSSPAPKSDNPYAQQPAADPYADNAKYANVTPYQQAKNGLGPASRPSGSSSYGGSTYGAPSPGPPSYGGSAYGAPSPGPSDGGYGAPPPSGGYSSEKYGSGGGYGGSRYGSSNNASAPAAGARGPGGYGGFGGADDADDNRDALFAGAQKRYVERQQNPAETTPSDQDGQSGIASATYGGYGEDRELTAEEQEEAELQGILSQKRQLQQESASSVNRSVLMARQAHEVGRATLARLGAQGERLNNTEKNLDMASIQNKVAQDRAAELKKLNRSMFAVHVGNPFTAKERQRAADQEVMSRHRAERDEREATRRDGYSSNTRMESTFRELDRPMQRRAARKKDYGKFNLDDEEGADELEDQIDDGIDELEVQVSMMNRVGRAIGKEVDSQNKSIDRIMDKSDAVDDATRMNRERLARIK